MSMSLRTVLLLCMLNLVISCYSIVHFIHFHNFDDKYFTFKYKIKLLRKYEYKRINYNNNKFSDIFNNSFN